jgi:hypothetical protein
MMQPRVFPSGPMMVFDPSGNSNRYAPLSYRSTLVSTGNSRSAITLGGTSSNSEWSRAYLDFKRIGLAVRPAMRLQVCKTRMCTK